MSVDEPLLYRLVGDRVRRARTAVGMSQAKLAKKLGMSRTSVVNVEAGRQHAPLHVLWQIAEALDTDLALLIPSADDYREGGQPLKLDEETVRRIEEAVSGDAAARRDLTRFVVRAVSRTTARGNDGLSADRAD